jgi:hypothetical protein
MHYLITANVNVARDGAGFRGYQPHHPVATVGYFDVSAPDAIHAADIMFAIGNREGRDSEGREWPSDVRSLSVGDVLYLAQGDEQKTYAVHILAVEPRGWREVPQPPNHCQVALEGTDATSRQPRLAEGTCCGVTIVFDPRRGATCGRCGDPFRPAP